MRKKKRTTYIYKFTNDDKGRYILTEKAENSLRDIERILGAVRVKGNMQLFEKIEIRDRMCPENNGIYLTERNNLDFNVVSLFICHSAYMDRSEEHKPYWKDLLDKDLLDDLGIEVLMSKWYYSGNDFLATTYYPIRKEEITEDIKQHLKEEAKRAEDEATRCRQQNILFQKTPMKFEKLAR